MEKDGLDHLKDYLCKEANKDHIKPKAFDKWGPLCATCKRAKWGPSFLYTYCACPNKRENL